VCCDASIIPTTLNEYNIHHNRFWLALKPVAINVYAKITALGERFCVLFVERHNLMVYERPNGELDRVCEPIDPSFPERKTTRKHARFQDADMFRFSEILEDHIHIGSSIISFTTIEKVAKGASSAARRSLTIDVPNVADVFDGLVPPSALISTGSFLCGAIMQDSLLILGVEVQIFAVDEGFSHAKNLVYKVILISTNREMHLPHGFKKTDSNMAFSRSKTWKATTTLCIVFR
jgi:hypothetical protein